MPLYWVPITIAALFVVISLAISYIFSGIVLHALRQPIVSTPKAHGLEYENVEFESVDGLLLKGWFIPAEPGGDEREKVIILTHPFSFNRNSVLDLNNYISRLA